MSDQRDTVHRESIQRESVHPARMIAVWCPDWPVVAAHQRSAHQRSAHHSSAQVNRQYAREQRSTRIIGDPTSDLLDDPIAVVTANLVVACSHAARRAGVRRGMRRREAQSRCPDLTVLARDEAGEARAFEPVVAAIESIAPGVEITRPGLAAIGAHGPSRYFGGETAVVHALSRRLGELNRPEMRHRTDAEVVEPVAIGDPLIGAADGSFAAEQAARRGLLVPPGESAQFLADLPIDTVEAGELADLLRRLGIRTLGAFADLPARDVLARFGPSGAWVHRQCGGRDARPIAARSPATEHTVGIVFEPALDRVDAIAFSARTATERFIDGLVAHGLACTCLELVAQTDNGEETARTWRQNGVLTSVDVLDRIRWQLEGWLNGGYGTDRRAVAGPDRPTAGVTLLRLSAVQVVPIGAHQQSLWSGAGADDERAHRALARVQTLLGHGSVVTAVITGGREPAERTRLVAWGDERGDEQGGEQGDERSDKRSDERGEGAPFERPRAVADPAISPTGSPATTAPTIDRSSRPPWPGHIPAPAPSVLIDPPRPVQVLDAAGRVVTVTARGAVPAPPARLALSDAPVALTAWAGPWPVDDNWWSRSAGPSATATAPVPLRRRARFQVVDVHGRAYLVTCSMPLLEAGDGRGETAHDAEDMTPRWTLDALYD